jgi:hypothetical protein
VSMFIVFVLGSIDHPHSSADGLATNRTPDECQSLIFVCARRLPRLSQLKSPANGTIVHAVSAKLVILASEGVVLDSHEFKASSK